MIVLARREDKERKKNAEKRLREVIDLLEKQGFLSNESYYEIKNRQQEANLDSIRNILENPPNLEDFPPVVLSAYNTIEQMLDESDELDSSKYTMQLTLVEEEAGYTKVRIQARPLDGNDQYPITIDIYLDGDEIVDREKLIQASFEGKLSGGIIRDGVFPEHGVQVKFAKNRAAYIMRRLILETEFGEALETFIEPTYSQQNRLVEHEIFVKPWTDKERAFGPVPREALEPI